MQSFAGRLSSKVAARAGIALSVAMSCAAHGRLVAAQTAPLPGGPTGRSVTDPAQSPPVQPGTSASSTTTSLAAQDPGSESGSPGTTATTTATAATTAANGASGVNGATPANGAETANTANAGTTTTTGANGGNAAAGGTQNQRQTGLMAMLPEPVRRVLDGFSFGSYGRVVVSSDLRGHSGREANLVAWGTRIDDQTYSELEVHRDDDFAGGIHTRVVATLAITGPLFHQSGTFDAQIAVRNLYIEARDVLTRGLALWVGSRMYRGDDIYLLNWWPLDNLNTVGGGARYDIGQYATVAAHVGTNRLDTNYQFQRIRVVPRDGIGAASVVLLDRPRFIASLKGTLWFMGRTARAGLKASLYGEVHSLPDGVRQNSETGERELLRPDGGYVLGAQFGAYTGRRDTFVNVFFRFAQGLAAYGDLAVPYTLSAAQTAQRAQDARIALSGNFEHEFFGIMAGGYVRYFRDADPSLFGRNDLWEGTMVVRPTIWIGQHAGVSAEGSYQMQAFNMLDSATGRARTASAWRFGVIPFVTPAGRGNFTRPHLRAIYAVTLRDDGALRLYAPDDPFARFNVEHYAALSCEWWFNSSYL